MMRAVARIDLAAVERNCVRLRSELREKAELCAVVKADGYGHGAEACVEAAHIGRRFPQVPLLTMGALTPDDLDTALAGGSEIAVWRDGFRRLAADRARAQGRPARVHVKYDSGMGRLGNPDPEETLALVRACAGDPDLALAGVWTHFATADELDSEYFDRQRDRFASIAAAVKSEFPGTLVHAANSAAVFRDPSSHFDMARCGVAVYGLDPFQGDPAERGLEPALSLHSYVADVKPLPAGESVGYGRTWRAAVDTWIGVLPLGYGDGVRRGLSNNAEVLIGERRYPLVGTVSMDNVTVDLGPETDVEPGAEAVLIGGQGGERILAEEVARRLGTINYEVTCGIYARVPRERA